MAEGLEQIPLGLSIKVKFPTLVLTLMTVQMVEESHFQAEDRTRFWEHVALQLIRHRRG